ncbi:MAG: hypothetical protein HY319_05360 [Armatimonadetes bacterium]|nr:hypothetical protein [Armatimonadota bacterium]
MTTFWRARGMWRLKEAKVDGVRPLPETTALQPTSHLARAFFVFQATKADGGAKQISNQTLEALSVLGGDDRADEDAETRPLGFPACHDVGRLGQSRSTHCYLIESRPVVSGRFLRDV